jgi:response regulator NasT
LKVLLADANQERADAVSRDLMAAGIDQIVRLAPNARLIDAVRAELPDVVIVDMARPDRDSLEAIREVTARDPLPIVMFVDRDDGVSSYNLVGSALPDVKPIAQAAVAIFRRYQKVAAGLHDAEEKLNERIIIQRAKSLLIQQRKMTEPQAHKWLRQNAMNGGKRMVDIATALLQAAGEKP